MHKRGLLNRTENGADGGAGGLRKFLTQVVNRGVLSGTAAAFGDSGSNNRNTEDDHDAMVEAAVMESTANDL